MADSYNSFEAAGLRRPVRSHNGLPGFWSFKCTTAIVYTRRCARDALIQATLDPTTHWIEPYPDELSAPADAFFWFVATKADRRCLVVLCDDTNDKFLETPPGIDLAVSISRRELLSEPIATTSRMIWSRRDLQVPPLFTIKVLALLKHSPKGLRLIEFEGLTQADKSLWVDHLFAMACRGIIELKFNGHLTDETLVSLGPEVRLEAISAVR